MDFSTTQPPSTSQIALSHQIRSEPIHNDKEARQLDQSHSSLPDSTQLPSRQKGSLGQSGAVFRRSHPQSNTEATSDALQSVHTRPSVDAEDPRSPVRPVTISQEQQSEDQKPDEESPSSDEYSEEEQFDGNHHHIQLAQTMSGVLGQLAGGKEPAGDVDLEQEADNLVHCKFFYTHLSMFFNTFMFRRADENAVFLYGTALVFKSFVKNVADGEGWRHIEELTS